MAWYEKIISSGVSDVVDSVGGAIDRLVTSDEERLVLKNELQKIQDKHEETLLREANKAEQIAQSNVTERWNIDSSGTILTKNIRPYTLIYLTVVITLLAIMDGNPISLYFFDLDIKIKDSWVDLFTTLTVAVYGAFFVGKTIERVKNKVV